MAKALKSSRAPTAPTASTSSRASVGDSDGSLQWAIRIGFVLGVVSILFGALDLLGFMQLSGAHATEQAAAAAHPNGHVLVHELHKTLLLYGIGFLATGLLQIVFSILLGKGVPWAVMGAIAIGALNGILALIVVVQAVMPGEHRSIPEAGIFSVWVLAVGLLIFFLTQSFAAFRDDTPSRLPPSRR